jgi:hypothetical protein
VKGRRARVALDYAPVDDAADLVLSATDRWGNRISRGP